MRQGSSWRMTDLRGVGTQASQRPQGSGIGQPMADANARARQPDA
jgi:hypothetical protein